MEFTNRTPGSIERSLHVDSEDTDLRPTIEKAPKRSSVIDGLRKDYECPKEYSRPRRAAHCFAWGAFNYPHELIPWSYVHMAINGYRKASASNSRDVVSLRSASGSIRKVLEKDYRMRLIRGPEIQARATVDDTDIGRTAAQSDARELKQKHAKFKKTISMINPANIKDPELRRWIAKDVGDILKLTDDKLMQKLLPPTKMASKA